MQEENKNSPENSSTPDNKHLENASENTPQIDNSAELDNANGSSGEANASPISNSDKQLEMKADESGASEKSVDIHHSESEKDEGEHEEDNYEDESELFEQIDIDSMSKVELIDFVNALIENPKLNIIRQYLNDAKDKFDGILIEEKKLELEKWIEGGGIEEDFKPEKDPLKSKFFSAFKKVNRLKHDIQNKRLKEKDDNLNLKKELLQKMKDVIQNENDMQKAFSEFHSIQDKWREIGPVPSAEVKDLWMTYKLYADKFYDLIKINRDLQKLDQQKNLEIKINLCEQMEDLLVEKDMHRVSMRTISLQNRWRTIGPVPREKNEEIWLRFKNAISLLNERKAKHEDELKERYANNLVKKKELCEKVEALNNLEIPDHNDWQKKIKEILEFQNKWKKAGPVAKAHNEEIWIRFRNACSEFFRKKNEFYQSRKEDQKAHIQAKTELCMAAEAIQESDDWKATSIEFKKLQEKWKESGRIPDKQSRELWNRFKKAGDIFFKRKSEHYAGFEKEQEVNLKLKTELVDKIETFTPGNNTSENIEQLKQFQREWMGIGFIPIKSKAAIQKKFRAAIDKQFSNLNIDEGEKEKIRFAEKVNSMKQSPDASGKLKSESFHLTKKIGTLQSEVNQWENNIGFFSHSKNAQDMKKEFELKIDKTKKEIELLKEKLNLIKQS